MDREHTGPVQAYQITQPQTSQQGMGPKYMSAFRGGWVWWCIFNLPNVYTKNAGRKINVILGVAGITMWESQFLG